MILVVGATGNLGTRICKALVNRGATVSAIVRNSTDPEKIAGLRELGVTVIEKDLNDVDEIAAACVGITCVVSTLAGLRDVIIDLQKRILDAAIQAGVSRFIPSDFCSDYNDLVPGENRNFDLRREFKLHLDSKPIKASSIFNGAFADILKYNTPVLKLKDRSIAYWGDKADWKLDFTSMDDTAAFTAEVALDGEAPRNLQVASFQISPSMIQSEIKVISGETFTLQEISSLEDFGKQIKKQRAENPAGEKDLYAKWQQAQYMYSMFSTHHTNLANDRYKKLTWISSLNYLRTFVK